MKHILYWCDFVYITLTYATGGISAPVNIVTSVNMHVTKSVTRPKIKRTLFMCFYILHFQCHLELHPILTRN